MPNEKPPIAINCDEKMTPEAMKQLVPYILSLNARFEEWGFRISMIKAESTLEVNPNEK